jgi:hypothetical protein
MEWEGKSDYLASEMSRFYTARIFSCGLCQKVSCMGVLDRCPTSMNSKNGSLCYRRCWARVGWNPLSAGHLSCPERTPYGIWLAVNYYFGLTYSSAIFYYLIYVIYYEENIVMVKEIDPFILTDLHSLTSVNTKKWFLICRLSVSLSLSIYIYIFIYLFIYVCLGGWMAGWIQKVIFVCRLSVSRCICFMCVWVGGWMDVYMCASLAPQLLDVLYSYSCSMSLCISDRFPE